MIGQTVSHYRIIEKVGAGGMGVVYRAEDTKLRRIVALKFLPPELTRDEAAKQRFIQEAQAASALDHPNICTIHEIDETADGQLFLVMALYEGETLKDRLGRGPLSIDDAVDYGRQIGLGLAKAHAAGIVHRDIKPANLFVTRDGLIKILDFGLVKLLGQTAVTHSGMTLGTVSYMSPEQTKGYGVDRRSDIWSLGVVLYEMLSGQLPFTGDHAFAVANAIVQAAPPPLRSVRADVSTDLDQVVNRALAKNPDDRYATAAELVSDLGRVSGASTPSAATGIASGSARATRVRAFALRTIALATIGMAFVAAYLLLARRDSTPPALANPVQIAATVGYEDFASWSPDGRTVAYTSNQAGNDDIWIAQLGGGAVNRTADSRDLDRMPRISPDGRQIAFWSTRDGGGFFVMPLLSGTARKIPGSLGPFSFGAVAAWSPDSTELAYPVADQNQMLLERLTLTTGATRRVPWPGRPGNGRLDATWSPDGRFIAYVDARNSSAQTSQLGILRLSDGQGIRIGDGRMSEWSPSWTSDSRAIFFVSNRGGTMDLWRQRIAEDGSPDGGRDRLTTGLEIRHAAVAPDGRRVAYTKGRTIGNVWRMPLGLDRPATWSDTTQLTFDQAYIEYADISSDGQRLMVSSDRSGNPDLWSLPAGGGDMEPFTLDPTPDWSPAWSPDGMRVAFYAYRSGNREIWVQPTAGGVARQLTSGEAESVNPAWSPDGRFIVFSSRRSGSSDLYVMTAEGTDVRRLTSDADIDDLPAWSPDGKWIVFVSYRSAIERNIWRIPAGGGERQLILSPGGFPLRWSRDSQWVYFLRSLPRQGVRNVWAVSADGQTERQITDFAGRGGNPSPNVLIVDERFLYFGWNEQIGDIWVIDIVEPQ